MNEQLPSVTVIIAARPDQAEIKAVAAARQLDYPPDRLEIIVARGKQPSVQRNAAARVACGEWIYFLDDDSVPRPDNLRRAIKLLDDPKVSMVGGPNVCPPDAPPLEQAFAVVLASWLAFGPSRARYTPVGAVRASNEKELILCNLMARRAPMLELGGFNEALYPNEENALMDALAKRGGRLMYDPGFFVYRRPRHSLKAFSKMLMTYGRGRAEQFRVHPTVGSAPNFVPPLFLAYLLALAVTWVVPLEPAWQRWRGILTAPLAVYAVALLAQAMALMPRAGIARSLCAVPLMFLSHVLYGFGFWRGLFTKLNRGANRPKVEVKLENIRP